jgi:hypothetical protein
MSQSDYIDWQGQSGKTYRYIFMDMSLPFNAVAVNYAFVKALGNNRFRVLYFGETDDAKSRITPAHEKWAAAIASGMTHVMAHSTQGGEKVRRDEERDLIAHCQPVLNIQYKQAK